MFLLFNLYVLFYIRYLENFIVTRNNKIIIPIPPVTTLEGKSPEVKRNISGIIEIEMTTLSGILFDKETMYAIIIPTIIE